MKDQRIKAARMYNTLGIVEVSDGTSYLLARRFGNRPLLEWVARRVTDAQRLDHVIVLCGAADRRVVEMHKPADVPLFVSDAGDSLARLADASEKFLANALLRVASSNPFIDPALIDGLVGAAELSPNVDYASYRSANGKPALLSQVGVFGEWCRADAIRQAHEKATEVKDRRDATRYLYTHPEFFQLRLVALPDALDCDDVRLGINGEEDWDHAQVILDALGPDRLDWQRIAGLLQQQPAIRRRMAVLNHSDTGL